MKKIITMLFSMFLLLSLASCDQNTAKTEVETSDDNLEEVLTEGYKNQQGGVTVGDDIINEDARFVYFYSKTCPHCQDLNKYLLENDMYNKVPLEKLELNENPDNIERFTELTTKLGDEGAGVPFVYDTLEEKYVVGTDKAIVLFEAYAADNNTPNSEEDTTVVEEELPVENETEVKSEDDETTAEIEDQEIKGNLVD